ncbi:MAG TPA: aminotransferase class I/II-fold pyridoxal phosphate-dependent enzyme [Jatrophihabitans sp.]|nr:aminotransferase class I/II-fold pyridoxal phosphate-dependent enzyme [Jatrophihabitans sp.]
MSGAGPAVSPLVDALPPSGIRAIATAAWAIEDAVHLEFGEPDFDTPEHIVEAGFRAARRGATRYGPSAGLPALREAICAKLARDNGVAGVRPEQVIVTPGGVGAIALAYRAVLDLGSEVLVPDPGWPNLAGIAQLYGAEPVRYRLAAATGFRPDLDRLDALVTERTRALVINSPANPLGTVWPPDTLRELADWATRRGLWIISDECYDQLWHDRPATSLLRVAPEAPVITVFSLSKSYAMTGWRVGYAVGPAELIGHLTRIQETWTSCVSTPTQHAALAALSGDQAGLITMRSAYRRRRDAALRRAGELGLDVHRPDGAFYLWLRLPDRITDSTGFALHLLEESGVAVAPGRAFGPAGEGQLRLSLAASQEHLERGLTAIRHALDRIEDSYCTDQAGRPTTPAQRSAASVAGR